MVSVKKLYSTLQTPKLWTPSPDPLWSDEHISQGMLDAHLNPDFDGASRREGVIDRSVQWIANIFAPATGKSLLDLGCGPGLYTQRFYQSGFRVFGLDLSSRSIAYAQAHTNTAITYVCGDYINSSLPGAMDVVTMIYCDFGVLPPDARSIVLRKIFETLNPGGYFLFDVFTPTQYATYQESSMITENKASGFCAPVPHIVLERKISYPDSNTFLHQVNVITENDDKVYYIWEHVFTPQELVRELHEAGFHAVEIYGDVCGSPLSLNSKTLCAIAKKS